MTTNTAKKLTMQSIKQKDKPLTLSRKGFIDVTDQLSINKGHPLYFPTCFFVKGLKRMPQQ